MSNGIIASNPYKRSRSSSFIAQAKSAESRRLANAGEAFAETLKRESNSDIIGGSGFRFTSPMDSGADGTEEATKDKGDATETTRDEATSDGFTIRTDFEEAVAA